MSIFVIGVNHKTAQVTLREQVYFPLEKLSLYLQDLQNRGYVREAVLLSTCNRSELYCDAEDINLVRDWFCTQTAAPRAELEPALYIYHQEEAVAHIMQVACGLDSMILGEPQILGQMKEAFAESCSAGTVCALFHRLFQQIFMVAKEIRTSTSIGACPVSVASAAVQFAKAHCSVLSEATVALIGAGSTTELLLRYLQHSLLKPILIVNRNLEKAVNLAQAFHGEGYGIEKMVSVLARADIVIAATGSAIPVVTKAMAADAMRIRGERPSVFIDIAVPRDMDPSIAELPNVQLYCIDDLMTIIEKNRQGREHAADKAREMIRRKSQEFMMDLTSLGSVSHTIRAYRGQIEDMCRAELLKAKQQLHQGMDPAQVLDGFAHVFTQKLLHTPSVRLRQAGVEGRFEILKFAKHLFSIADPEIECL